MRRLLLLLLCPLLLYGQGTKIQQSSVANLPAATSPSVKNSLFMVMDGSSTTDCTVGGGAINVLCQSNGTIWIPIPGNGGTPAGAPIQTQVNNGGVFGGTPCESFATLNLGPANVDCDWHSKGPNPYVDVTRFGVRSCNPLATPCSTGLTATTTATSASVTISSASTFVNGDGVVIYGAGAPQSMATPGAPTVTPSIARGPTGGRDVTTGPTGATTYNYEVFAEDKNGGLTAVSSVGSTTTGASSLGPQTVNITSCSRANNTVTCITAAHGLATGTTPQMVYIRSASDISFNGWYSTSNVADSTHFSFVSNQDTRSKANTSATGGTLTWFGCNHVSWSAVTGAYRYWIAGRTGGSLTTIGYSWPVNPSFSNLVQGILTWDDYGSPMMDGLSLPAWVPSTPPASATSDHLVTTISSGGGSTSLTLALAAGTSVSGKTIRLDATPGIKAAEVFATTTLSTYPIYFPEITSGTSDNYCINSLLDLTATQSPVWVVSGSLSLFNTVMFPAFARITGLPLPQSTVRTSFMFEPMPLIEVRAAYPGFHITNGATGRVEGIAFDGASFNNNLLILQDFGSASAGVQYRRMTLSTGSQGGASDVMSLALLVRDVSPPSGLAGSFSLDEIDLLSGPGSGTLGTTATPSILCTGCGPVSLGRMIISARSIHIGLDPSFIGGFTSQWSYSQGADAPIFSVGSAFDAVNPGNGLIRIGQIVNDTTNAPLLANFNSGGGAGLVTVIDESTIGNSPGFPQYTGQNLYVNRPASTTAQPNTLGLTTNASITAQEHVIDGIIGTNNGPVQQINYNQANVAVGPMYSVLSDLGPMAPPTATVTAGGSVPVGTHQYFVAPVWQNNGTGAISYPVSVTTTTGNQTVNLTWVATQACKGYAIFRDIGGQLLTATVLSVTGCATTTYTDTAALPVGGAGLPGAPGGGPNMFMPGVQGIATTALNDNGFQTNGPFNNGVLEVSGYFNSGLDYFNRANGGIAAGNSNWTVYTTGCGGGCGAGPNVSSNQLASPGNGFFQAANFAGFPLANDQFAQVVWSSATTATTGFALIVRGTSGTTYGNNYACKVTGTAPTTFIIELAGSTLTSTTGTLNSGDILRCQIVGFTVTFTQNGTAVLTNTTASSVTSGVAGLYYVAGANSSIVDNFIAGNIHPLANLDNEQEWTQPQHFDQPVTVGPTNPVIPLASNTLYSPVVGFVEAAAPSTVAGIDLCNGSSTFHELDCSYNNGTPGRVALLTQGDSTYGTYRVAADQTITAGASLTNIPGLAWTMPANLALNVAFECKVLYSQATAAGSDQFGIQDVTVAPTNIMAEGQADTSATAFTAGNAPTITTTTATSIVTFTPSAATTIFSAYLSGMVEQPSNAAASVINIMAQFTTNNGTIKRGSFCRVW